MQGPLIESLASRGVSRRSFAKYCATLASMMALPPMAGQAMAQALAAAPAAARRPSVIWLPFQECTGCTEAITRSHSPTLESLIFESVSLDYQETLMAAAGHQAEEALQKAMKDNAGKYLLIVDGSIPLGLDGAYSCIGGRSNLETLKEVAKGAAAVIAMGSCSSFGGLPKANPNPTGAVSVSDIIKDKPVVNIPGCPPIPVVMTAVLAHFVTFGSLPELDKYGRPKSFYGETIHDRCYRRPFYDQGKFAKTFDDEGARNGWCLFELGCKGPVTYNSCATTSGMPARPGRWSRVTAAWVARSPIFGMLAVFTAPCQHLPTRWKKWQLLPAQARRWGWPRCCSTAPKKAQPKPRTKPPRWLTWRNNHE